MSRAVLLFALLLLAGCAQRAARRAWRATPETCAVDTVTGAFIQPGMRDGTKVWDCVHTRGAIDSVTRAALDRLYERSGSRRPLRGPS